MAPVLSPKAWSAIEWTAEHMLPWAERKATGLFKAHSARKARARAIEEIRHTARACPASRTMKLRLEVVPNSKHDFVRTGETGGRVGFRVICTCVAPFGVRPSMFEGIVALIGYPAHSKGRIILKKEVVSDFLMTGERKVLEFDEAVEWDRQPGPKANEALVIACSGTLTVLGPWDLEYGEVDFSDTTYVRVAS